MLIDCSTCSNALAGGGDKARETVRLVACAASEGATPALNCKSVSPSESEPGSASLQLKSRRPTSQGWRSQLSPVKQQSNAVGESGGVIEESAHRKNNRATPREHSPASALKSSARERNTGNHNRAIDRKENAEGLIVAKKRGNACGAKEPYCETRHYQKRKETA
jgi:hypothetical protein